MDSVATLMLSVVACKLRLFRWAIYLQGELDFGIGSAARYRRALARAVTLLGNNKYPCVGAIFICMCPVRHL